MKSVTSIINDSHLNNNSTLGYDPDITVHGDPLNPSINFSSAYAFSSIDDLGNYHENKYDSVRYARDSSLIVRQLEKYFSLMHSESPSLLFNSGMAALSACFQSKIRSNSRIITFNSFYRKSLSIFERYIRNFSVEYENYSSYEDVEGDASDNIIILLETPSNPFLKLIDIDFVRHKFPNAIIILDTTFQGLLNSKSNYAGVDLVVGSCTKYIGGHNDLLGGFVCCINAKFYNDIWDERSMCGGIMDNMSAYFLLRSLRTYDLRMAKTLENVNFALEYLSSQSQIERIYYPGKYQNKHQERLMKNSMYHGGGVITFEVNSNVNLEENFKLLCSTKMAPSFGSVDSLIEIPAYMSHWGKSRESIEKLGLTTKVVRYSVGNEPWSFLENDLHELLKS